MHQETHQAVRLIIYGDFNCPFSALASARATELEARDHREVEWLRVPEHRANAGLAAVAYAGAPGLGALNRLRDMDDDRRARW